MKNKIITLLTLFVACCLVNTQQINAQCASYESAQPPPYPDTYPCLAEIFNSDPMCCDVEFDIDCVNALRTYCDINGGGDEPDGNFNSDCWFDQCTINGPKSTRMPFCPSICPAYFSNNPPPGPNPPTFIDGRLFEVFLFDGECCFTEFDNICETLLDSIGFYICDDQDANTIDDATFELGCIHTPIPSTPIAAVKLKAFIEGPYIGDETMTTELAAGGLIPTSHPFSGAPWNYSGTESVDVLPDNVVDWVLVEARDPNDNTQVISTQVGFLLSDGNITDIDGIVDGITFIGARLNNEYYVVIRTRNHLPVITSTAIVFSPNNDTYNFGASANQTLGTGQTKIMSDGTFALLGGDLDGNGSVTVADLNIYYGELSILDEYRVSDINMDKIVSVTDFNIFGENAGTIGVDQVRFD